MAALTPVTTATEAFQLDYVGQIGRTFQLAFNPSPDPKAIIVRRDGNAVACSTSKGRGSGHKSLAGANWINGNSKLLARLRTLRREGETALVFLTFCGWKVESVTNLPSLCFHNKSRSALLMALPLDKLAEIHLSQIVPDKGQHNHGFSILLGRDVAGQINMALMDLRGLIQSAQNTPDSELDKLDADQVDSISSLIELLQAPEETAEPGA